MHDSQKSTGPAEPEAEAIGGEMLEGSGFENDDADANFNDPTYRVAE